MDDDRLTRDIKQCYDDAFQRELEASQKGEGVYACEVDPG